MRPYKKIILSILIVISPLTGINAQNTRTAYFMDNATHRHSLNPAFQTPTGYVSIPALGAIQVGFNTNTLTVKNLFTPNSTQGSLVSFLHGSVDAGQFLGNLKNDNYLNTDISLSLLSSGFFTKIGYFTIDVGLKSYAATTLPKGLFEFAKLGMTNENGQTYHFKNVNLDASIYTDIAIGYSRKLDERLTVGGKAKLLLGFADASMRYTDIIATLNDDKWTMTTQGTADIVASGITPTYRSGSNNIIDGIDYSSGFGINGAGFGIDLGATFKMSDLFDGTLGSIFDNLTLSAAIIDLGFISWNKKNAVQGVATGEEFEFSGFDLDFGDGTETPSVQDQLSDLGDQLKDIFYFNDQISTSRNRMLRSTLNLGAEYSLFEDQLGIGLLSSTRFGAPKTYSELTLSGNYQPLNWLGITLSYSFIHSYFQTFGWAINLSPSWINFFIGSDYMITNVAKPFVPMTNAMNINLGISVPIANNKSEQ